LSLLLVACQTVDRPNPVASKEALAEAIVDDKAANTTPPPAVMPDDVQRELSSDNLLQGFAPARPTERRFDVSANNVDAKVFFPSLAQGTPLSVAVHPDVTGKISLSLKSVTLQEALQVVEDIYGYEVSREGRILRIFPAGMRTETFSLNYLYMERQGLSLTSVSSGRISDNDSNSNGNSNSNGS
ncbi:secretin N-terminal domain-containing protein, partial [Shewanella sp. 0m-11]